MSIESKARQAVAYARVQAAKSDPALLAKGAELAQSWYQVSGKYRHVARLPDGIGPREALARASGRVAWAHAMSEWSAGDFYLGVHSPPEDRMTLTIEEWTAYKLAGGGTYGAYCARTSESFGNRNAEATYRLLLELSTELRCGILGRFTSDGALKGKSRE